METWTTIVASLGGATAISLILWKLLGDIIKSGIENSFKRDADRIRRDFDKKLQSRQHQFEMTLERVKKAYEAQFDNLKASLQRYSEGQFDVYRELWVSLCELKVTADELWVSPTQRKVEEFGKQLRTAKQWLEKSAILIEEEHYQSLGNLFRHFTEFFYGKTNLLELPNRNDIDEEEKERHRREFIDGNSSEYQEYNDILVDLKRYFREQIRGDYFKEHQFANE